MSLRRELLASLCEESPHMCESATCMISGCSPDSTTHFNKTRWPVYASHYPSGESRLSSKWPLHALQCPTEHYQSSRCIYAAFSQRVKQSSIGHHRVLLHVHRLFSTFVSTQAPLYKTSFISAKWCAQDRCICTTSALPSATRRPMVHQSLPSTT